LRVFTANMRAAREYRPRPYPGRVLLVRAADGDRLAGAGPTAGWGELARGGVEVVEVPGDHWTLVEPPHVALLARELERRLGRGLSSPHR
jgi:thioesterase domain-containing protein